mmetsp:Transcript_82576/g.230903  ORF Transcript_82576/g.230903 Transcript_82576/m.230903 type:complete len:320 (+) Transcript_82576:3-962(+)
MRGEEVARTAIVQRAVPIWHLNARGRVPASEDAKAAAYGCCPASAAGGPSLPQRCRRGALLWDLAQSVSDPLRLRWMLIVELSARSSRSSSMMLPRTVVSGVSRAPLSSGTRSVSARPENDTFFFASGLPPRRNDDGGLGLVSRSPSSEAPLCRLIGSSSPEEAADVAREKSEPARPTVHDVSDALAQVVVESMLASASACPHSWSRLFHAGSAGTLGATSSWHKACSARRAAREEAGRAGDEGKILGSASGRLCWSINSSLHTCDGPTGSASILGRSGPGQAASGTCVMLSQQPIAYGRARAPAPVGRRARACGGQGP